eukprot:898421-Amphidinium_carterae.1
MKSPDLSHQDAESRRRRRPHHSILRGESLHQFLKQMPVPVAKRVIAPQPPPPPAGRMPSKQQTIQEPVATERAAMQTEQLDQQAASEPKAAEPQHKHAVKPAQPPVVVQPKVAAKLDDSRQPEKLITNVEL